MIEESKYYNYVNKVLETICEYYNYKYIKLDNIEDILSKIKEMNSSDKFNSIKAYYFNNSKNELGIIAKGFKSNIIIVDIISLCYRFLEELGLNDVLVKINTNQKEIIEYLNYLEVDYEINDEKIDNLTFEIINNNNLICKGLYNSKDNYVNVCLKINTIVEEFKKVANFNAEKGIDVYVTGTSMEEKLTATLLVQNLRWSEIITEMDYDNKPLFEQVEEANKLHARIIIKINEEDLKKGLLNVIDNLTKEETKIDENEILDYILSNL